MESNFSSLSQLLVEFIENVPADRLAKQKVMCMDAIIQSSLFTLPGHMMSSLLDVDILINDDSQCLK